ncbi:MAG: Fic family protein [Planctomycetota bacterium]|nr:Fic family protein [Planctomycetota bacterium]
MSISPMGMTPPMPSIDHALENKAVSVIRESAALGGALHPRARGKLLPLLENMNSYYSNLIEGHHTRPRDIERALKRDFSKDAAQRALQTESVAHVVVQRMMHVRLMQEPRLEIASRDFLGWLHAEFYKRMPEEFHFVEDHKGAKIRITPGEFRNLDVEVGQHMPPHHGELSLFLAKFEEFYSPQGKSEVEAVVAAAASHHRLLWIHPFLDGNGRVARLFTHAYLSRARIDGHGLWTISRGFARTSQEYKAALAGADRARQGDLDGRGGLTHAGLYAFSLFFLNRAADQIAFMRELLELEGLETRVRAYIRRESDLSNLPRQAEHLVLEALFKGSFRRGDAQRITGADSERTARRLLGATLASGLLEATTEKGPVEIAFPMKAVEYYFPRLFPEGADH